MKKLLTLMLAAGLVFGAATGAKAIDFGAKGIWLMGFTGGDFQLLHKTRNGSNTVKPTNDKFDARQRIRIQLDAAASENLSGSVQLEIGNQIWGQNETGAALGTDSTHVVKVRQAYLDWAVPDVDLSVRMGLQTVTLPNAAGGSAVMDSQVAGVTASYKINDNVGITAVWMRPFNDNYVGDGRGDSKSNFLDNMDLVSLAIPINLDGFEITPWAMWGMQGKNTFGNDEVIWNDGDPRFTMRPYPALIRTPYTYGSTTGKAYGNMFWAGLPFKISAFDPLNIEVDVNYGYIESMGRFAGFKGPDDLAATRFGSTERQGFLAKALVEYKMDWGVPGIFGWYGSGDDGNIKNGSERMPSIDPCGTFTSMMGDGNMGWSWQDYDLSYAGTWGVGLQLRDLSFLEDLSHTVRVAWWGGTNSTGMVKYMDTAYAWHDGWGNYDGPYLTTNDGLLELNLVNNYQIYENLNVNLELGYIANFVDNSTWKKAGNRDSSFGKQDAWKAQLVFAYEF